MQAPSIPSSSTKHQVPPAWVAMIGTFSVFGLFRMLQPGRAPKEKNELRDDQAVLWDAHGSLRRVNPARSGRVLPEWLKSRGDQPEDCGRLFVRMFDWEDGRVISQLTE